ncbi:hypothetical protein QBC39DRAFT_44811 [Podospora conica]|nr:hypothetical protein QBC39DRAFT_44811 [Schizothecium conicum]
MAPLATIVAATLSLLSTASAHFVLLNPPSLEGSTLDDKKEGNAPCGALLPDLTQTPTYDFHVDGDFLSLQNGHPQSNWLFRATLEDKAAGNWSQLYPLVQQTGIGNYCQLMVTAPKEWVGKKGVIGIVGNAPDGMLYQCAAVNFVAGTTTPNSDCKNQTGVAASFVADSSLTAQLGTGSPASTSTTPAPAPKETNAASSPRLQLGVIVGTVAMLAGTALL